MGLRRLLLADDEPVVQRAVRQAARDDELEVVAVSLAAEVLPTARALRPDAIVLDLNFPDASGFEVLSSLKADPQTADVPVVIWSAAASDHQRAESLRLGAACHIEKAAPEDLLRYLRSLFRSTRPPLAQPTPDTFAGNALDSIGISRHASNVDFSLELVRDGTGSLQIGWIAPRIIYARWLGFISARLGADYSRRFGALTAQCDDIACFVDARHVGTFDLGARSAFVRAVLAQRHRIRVFDMLLWPNSGYHVRQMLATLLGKPCRIFVDNTEFEKALQVASPDARGLIAQHARGSGLPPPL